MDQTQPELRVMVDANILIAGSVWPRWSFEVLQHALRGDFHLVLSNYILQQARAHIQTCFPNYSDQFDEFRNCWVASTQRASSLAIRLTNVVSDPIAQSM